MDIPLSVIIWTFRSRILQELCGSWAAVDYQKLPDTLDTAPPEDLDNSHRVER